MLRENSPSFGSSYFSAANAPPSPPSSANHDPLDDIYGSAPASPVLVSQHPLGEGSLRDQAHEILSDLPSRQRALDTDAYREGLSNSKSQYVQEGFDEGYSLGANLGQRVGYLLGVLQGLVAASKGHEEARMQEANGLWEAAQEELAIQELLGQKWVDEEGIWKWHVKGEEDEVTFREVAEQHPTIKNWTDRVRDITREWSVDLDAIENSLEAGFELDTEEGP